MFRRPDRSENLNADFLVTIQCRGRILADVAEQIGERLVLIKMAALRGRYADGIVAASRASLKTLNVIFREII